MLRCKRKALLSAVSPLVSARSTLAPGKIGKKCESLRVDWNCDWAIGLGQARTTQTIPRERGRRWVDFLLISVSPKIKTMAQTFMLHMLDSIDKHCTSNYHQAGQVFLYHCILLSYHILSHFKGHLAIFPPALASSLRPATLWWFEGRPLH